MHYLTFFVLVMLLIPGIPASGRGPAEIFHDVHVQPAPEKSATDTDDVTISWRQQQAGKTSLFICDLRGRIVRNLIDTQEYDAGIHSVNWDGLDNFGNKCASGIYFPIIQCDMTKRGRSTYNPTALDWGREVKPVNLTYDAGFQYLSFELQTETYARIRTGLSQGGPLLANLADWRLYPSGFHQLPLTDMQQRLLSAAADHSDFTIIFDGFTVPPASIVLQDVDVPATVDYPTFPVHPPATTRPSYCAVDLDNLRPSPLISLEIPTIDSDPARMELSGQVSCRIASGDSHALSTISGRSAEVLLFIDHNYIKEVPAAELPVELQFNPSTLTDGPHTLTINLITGDDRVGTVSREIRINNQTAAHQPPTL